MKKLIIIFAVILSSISLAQPKREFRGVWIATVTNLDFPSSRSLTTDAQKNEIITLFNGLQSAGINAVLFQVRSECDALYNSFYEPWSYWLTGQQGKAPNPIYDPLQFAIDEAHKRGMELHAWLNPYRVDRAVTGGYAKAANHISVVHPEWVLQTGNAKILNPGKQAVRDYITSIVMDIVQRYDVDGIHFDDYFYPYPPNHMTANATYNALDDSTFLQESRGLIDKYDWRRDNINVLMKQIYESIQSEKPKVKFGISPFGIWKNGEPSGIVGMDAYNVIYCDAITWLQEKTIDYLTPQLYWAFGGGQDYGKLMPWWNSYINGRHLYPGHGSFNIITLNWTSSELPNQIRLNRSVTQNPGSVFFRAKNGLLDNPKGFLDSLKKDLYKYPALVPTMPWKDSVPPLPPTNLVASGSVNGTILEWQKPGTAADGDTARYFVVYRAQAPDTINLTDPKYILAIPSPDSTKFIDKNTVNGNSYVYIVTAIDKLHNESTASAKINFTSTGVEQFAALPETFRLEQNFPNPFNPVTTIQFTLLGTEHATLKIYDLLGRNIATVVDEQLESGTHSYQFYAENLASGVYIYRLVAGNFIETKRMVLQK